MISNLPQELEEEILSRLEISSTRQLRSTCKRWYHHPLFKDGRFIKKIFDKTPKHYQALMLKDYRLFLLSSTRTHTATFLSYRNHLSLIDPKSNSEVYISQAFQCDGLFLCTTTCRRFVIWNPFSGQTRWIQQEDHRDRHEVHAFGYNNNELFRNYKILRFVDKYNEKVEIFEFRSNSWRNLDVSPSGYLQSPAVSLKGNTYWVSLRRRAYDYVLLKFDFSTERFQDLSLPIQKSDCFDKMSLSVVKEERLSVLCESAKTREMEIWVSNEIETKSVSWTKFLRVDVKYSVQRFPRHMSFFIEEQETKKAVFCYDKEGNSYILGEDGYKVSRGVYCTCNCLPKFATN